MGFASIAQGLKPDSFLRRIGPGPGGCPAVPLLQNLLGPDSSGTAQSPNLNAAFAAPFDFARGDTQETNADPSTSAAADRGGLAQDDSVGVELCQLRSG